MFSVWKHFQSSWTSLPFRTVSQATLSTSLLNRSKSSLQFCWTSSLLLWESKILLFHDDWAQDGLQPGHHSQVLTFHEQQVQQSTFLVGSLLFHTLQEPPSLSPLSCTLFPAHTRYAEVPMRTMASNGETSARFLKNASSASSSRLGGLELTHHGICPVGLPPDSYP